MFVDLDWPLNASSLLSASAELLVSFRICISMWGRPQGSRVYQTYSHSTLCISTEDCHEQPHTNYCTTWSKTRIKFSYCKQIACQHSCHKLLRQGQKHVRPCKQFPLIWFDHRVESVCTVSYLVGVVGGPKIFGNARGWPFAVGCADPLETPPPPCITMPNGSH